MHKPDYTNSHSRRTKQRSFGSAGHNPTCMIMRQQKSVPKDFLVYDACRGTLPRPKLELRDLGRLHHNIVQAASEFSANPPAKLPEDHQDGMNSKIAQGVPLLTTYSLLKTPRVFSSSSRYIPSTTFTNQPPIDSSL